MRIEAKPPRPQTIFDVANDLIYGDRNKSYGHPRDNFATTAQMWNAYIDRRQASHEARSDDAFKLEPVDVAYMLALVKMSRLASNPDHSDSRIDICGYIGCAERLDEEEV